MSCAYDDASLARLLTIPGAHDHKYTRGVLGVWAGSQTYPGAALLTTTAAVRTGVGMVRLLAPTRVLDLVLVSRPDVVGVDGRCQAFVIGPGTDPADTSRAHELTAALDRACVDEQPVIVDAGALALLPDFLSAQRARQGQHWTLGTRCILTPHAGEAATLLAALGAQCTRTAVEEAPASAARELARLTGAVVVLKLTPTRIAVPAHHTDDDVISLDAGPGWLATAGSGDVLAGVLGAVLASAQARSDANGRSLATEQITQHAALGVRLHALAGQAAATALARAGGAHEHAAHTGGPISAADIPDVLPGVVATMLTCVRQDSAAHDAREQ